MKIKNIAGLALIALPLSLAPARAGQDGLFSAPASFSASGQLLDGAPAEAANKAKEPLPAPASAPAPKPAALKYSPECVLRAVAELMEQKYRPEIPLPRIFFESSVTLKQFQDAVEPQWGQRPAQVTNVYVWNRNEIYLMDDAAWYAEHGRAMDDSLAHEFVHYIQHRYRGWDLSLDDPGYEPQAVEFQTLFRENYINKPGTCPAI